MRRIPPPRLILFTGLLLTLLLSGEAWLLADNRRQQQLEHVVPHRAALDQPDGRDAQPLVVELLPACEGLLVFEAGLQVLPLLQAPEDAAPQAFAPGFPVLHLDQLHPLGGEGIRARLEVVPGKAEHDGMPAGVLQVPADELPGCRRFFGRLSGRRGEAVRHLEAVRHYQLIQESANRVKLLVVPGESWGEGRRERLQDDLKHLLGDEMEVGRKNVSNGINALIRMPARGSIRKAFVCTPLEKQMEIVSRLVL